jgi:hypothetical protein
MTVARRTPGSAYANLPANGGFYFQAFSGSVALPAAGCDYNSVWTPLLAGLSPAGMAASLAALVRPCVASGFVDLVVNGLASMYPVSIWSCFAPDHHGYQRACDSLTDRPRQAIWVTSVRMRRQDRSFISTYPLADLGWKLLIGLRHRLLLISRSSFVRAKDRSFVPGPQSVDRVARRGGQGRPSRLVCG